jgi:hypothetical protein
MSSEITIIIGAIIGGSISIITNWLQQKNQKDRDLIKVAYDMAVKEYETLIKNGKPGTQIAPLEAFVTYYIEYLKIVKSKNFKLSDISKIREYRNKINEIYKIGN